MEESKAESGVTEPKPTEEKEVYRDLYYDSFFGMNELEKEIRADAWYQGCAQDYVTRKGELIKKRDRNFAFNCITDCYMAAPLRAYGFLTDVVTVMHSPIGCAYVLQLTAMCFGARVLTTSMDKGDALLGGERKLKATLRKAIDRYRPGMVGLCSTCTPEIIGEDIEGIAATVEAETGVYVVPFHAAGFRHKVWNIGTDEAYNIIVDRFMEKTTEKNEGSLNFVNFASNPEGWKQMWDLSPYIKALGVKVNAWIPFNMTFQEMIETVPKAELSVARCTGTGFQAMEFMEKRLGIPYVTAPRPFSYKYTEQWIRRIANHFGKQNEADRLIEREKNRYQERFEKAKRRLEGKKVAIGAGPGKFMAWCQMAAELGMEVVYMYPAKHDPRLRDNLVEWIKTNKQDPILITGAALYEHEAVLSQVRPDLFIGLPEEQQIALRLGIPAMDFISPDKPTQTGFEGTVVVAEAMADIIENKLVRNYGRHLYSKWEPMASPEWVRSRSIPLESLGRCGSHREGHCGYGECDETRGSLERSCK